MDLGESQLRLMDAQNGLLTEAQARAMLGGPAALRTAIALGGLVPVAPRVLALPGRPPVAVEMSAACVLVPGAVLGGPSAAVVHGLELAEPPEAVHLVVGRDRSRVSVPGSIVRRRRLAAADLEVLGGLPVLSVPATLADLARCSTPVQAVVAADSALRQGRLTPEQLREACAARGSGAARVRRLPGLVDPKAMSALESMCRLAMHEAGLPAPVTQLAVYDTDGTLLGYADFGWKRERVLLESDGFAWHRERDDYRKDRERLNAFTRLGWRLLRVTWEDVVLHPDRMVEMVRAVLLARPQQVRRAS